VSDAICVFVNERPVEVGPGSTVLRAVRLFDAALGERVARGEAIVTDGRGIAVPPDVLLSHGAILRVTAAGDTGAGDAHA
jgi:hypothetical protein